MTANQAQREQWNNESQVRNWPKRERVTANVTPSLIAAVAPKAGERLIDVGCGGGLAAIEAARAVGPSGAVTGFDISAGLVRLAAQRASEASVPNVRFVSGDAQVDDIPGAPFDAAMSQFGVMFFADPVAAFKNIRRHLKPGGRLAFACWQAAANNPWFPGPVLAKYAPPPLPPAQGQAPVGPFALADPGYASGILADAAFTDVRHESLELDVEVSEESVFDRELLDGMKLEPNAADAAWRDLQSHVAPIRIGDGKLRLHLAVWLVSARC
jgi:SAM-dependent methyltransferase